MSTGPFNSPAAERRDTGPSADSPRPVLVAIEGGRSDTERREDVVSMLDDVVICTAVEIRELAAANRIDDARAFADDLVAATEALRERLAD